MSHLSPSHNFQQVVCIDPADDGHYEERRDCRQNARVEESVGNPQGSDTQAEIDDEEEAEEYVNRFRAILGLTDTVEDLFRPIETHEQ